MKKILVFCSCILFSAMLFANSSSAAGNDKHDRKHCCDKCTQTEAKACNCAHHQLHTELMSLANCNASCLHVISPVKGRCPNPTKAVMKDGNLYCLMCTSHKEKGDKQRD